MKELTCSAKADSGDPSLPVVIDFIGPPDDDQQGGDKHRWALTPISIISDIGTFDIRLKRAESDIISDME